MRLYSPKQSIFQTCLTLLLISILSACGTKPTISSPTPTSVPPQPTKAEPATREDSSSLFKTGLSYSDASGDMEISFLDVVAFQAAVNEDSEILEVVLHMRDIPPTAPRGQVKNLIEYAWAIFVYLDPSTASPADIPGDFYFALNPSPSSPASGSLTPIPGEPIDVPINELFQNKNAYRSSGTNVAVLDVIAEPDLDTLLLKGRVPGIKSNAGFSFAMSYYDGSMDKPDHYDPESANVSTPLPESTVIVSDDSTQLVPAGTVRAYPGPRHYAGDVLTFEIQNDGRFGDETLIVEMTLDDNPPTEVSATSNFTNLLLPLALDTTNLSGHHMLKLTTADGRLNETYSFEVLPADQRPANEEGAAWMVNETNCCKLHYISETAAARDIEFIAEHFQQGAKDFARITGTTIDPKLDVYIIDRIWGNGGFGGNGEVVISYTDRFYGPSIGGVGLETTARHEFTHAAGIGLKMTGNGVNFSGEGLAVYVAGGHYKPEPLAERGAALLDLGYYVPVTQFIPQHELSYLYSAAMLTYIVETYGMEKMREFLELDDNPEDDQPGSLEAALQSTFGVSLKEFDQSFQAWLESKNPGEQLEDLRLTIELQDLRRQYQDVYSPPPYFINGKASDAIARAEYLPVVIREANKAPNVAVELIIAKAEQAILGSDYAEAQSLIRTLRDIISTSKFEKPVAKEYLDIALVLEEAGYETVSLDLKDDQATALVTMEPPTLSSVELEKLDGIWQVKP
jgi:hypothetical protein